MASQNWWDNDEGSASPTPSNGSADSEQIPWGLTTPEYHFERDLTWGDPQARTDFPKAIEPHFWYRFPPIEAGPPKPFESTRLGQLPFEVREIIWKMLIQPELSHTCDLLRAQRQSFSGPWYAPDSVPKKHVAYLLRGMQNLLGVCQEMRLSMMEMVMASTTYLCSRSDRFSSIVFDFRSHGHLKSLRKLQLGMHTLTNTRPEAKFPSLLRTFCNDLPSLESVELYTQFESFRRPSLAYILQDGAELVARHKRAARAVLRFAAFLVLRHPNLDLITMPAQSFPNIAKWQDTTCVLVRVVSQSSHLKQDHDDKDRIMNATKLRRHLWNEIIEMNLEDFVIDDKSTSSEVPENPSCFHRVDREGYKSSNWNGRLVKRLPVDVLIKKARKHHSNVTRSLARVQAQVQPWDDAEPTNWNQQW